MCKDCADRTEYPGSATSVNHGQLVGQIKLAKKLNPPEEEEKMDERQFRWPPPRHTDSQSQEEQNTSNITDALGVIRDNLTYTRDHFERLTARLEPVINRNRPISAPSRLNPEERPASALRNELDMLSRELLILGREIEELGYLVDL